MKRIAVIICLLLSSSAFCLSYQIVGRDVCSLQGNMLWQCSYLPVNFQLSVLDDVIPLETMVEINRNQYCRTQYPISLVFGYGEGMVSELNALSLSSSRISQLSSSELKFSVDAPYSNYARFDSRCSITANIEVDAVDLGKLEENIGNEKASLLDQIEVIDDRIGDKTTIQNLLEVADLYANIVSIANQDIVSYAQLNLILLESCEDADPCTWTDQINVVLNDPTVIMPFNQMLLLYNLATTLDTLVPADCTAVDNCLISIIDEQTEETIGNIASSIDTTSLNEEIRQLVDNRLQASNRLATLESIALDYNLDWSGI